MAVMLRNLEVNEYDVISYSTMAVNQNHEARGADGLIRSSTPHCPHRRPLLPGGEWIDSE
ncbi:hypothetical protein E2562_015741 [Oryza meyeriana var. granulata]|uniref:Uncharacterized protein n=1 Tax=Oryza meyeriana var. granulata TaxID=110450 RepID=A0A6G1D519_9ORYZ|nr:hypothetical protein E2562_015741 [Oryza meyeriana var. granulata]